MSQIDLFGVFIKIREKNQQCQYCKEFFKVVDNRHFIHCPVYRKTLPKKTQNHLSFLDGILKTSSLYLPKEYSEIILKNGKKIPMFFIDGHFVTVMPFFSDVCEEDNNTIAQRWRREKKKGMIAYPKSITRSRLLSLFESLLPVSTLPPASNYILLREDDMIYLASISSFKKTRMTLRYLIDYALKARNWICDLIYKLGRCNNREFLFLCAWLRLGYALDEIEPQRWYRLPNTTRRVDFRLKDGEILVEIDARGLELHDPERDKTTDRWFVQKRKLIIRFMNDEIDKNPLKCVRETINIAKENGVYISHQVLPSFIKGFVKNNEGGE